MNPLNYLGNIEYEIIDTDGVLREKFQEIKKECEKEKAKMQYTCNCDSCQVSKKSIAEQYAYYYALYKTSNSVLDCFEKAGVNFAYSELGNDEPLNTLGCEMHDACMFSSGVISDIEREYPEFKEWIKGWK